MTTIPGADELRIRHILRTRGVGPDAKPPANPTTEPEPARTRDWLDDILNAPTPAQAPDEPDDETAPAAKAPAAKPKKRKKPKPRDPTAPRTAFDTRPPAPRQSLIDAWNRIPGRLKWLTYHATAAYLGWTTGLVSWVTYVTAWIATTGPIGPQACLWYAVGAATLLLYARTRRRWWPVAWLAAVPASSLVVGVLLYGTGYHS